MDKKMVWGNIILWPKRLFSFLKELAFPTFHCWCGCNTFYEGPEGGGAQNLICTRCAQWYWYGGPFGMRKLEKQKPLKGTELTDPKIIPLKNLKFSWG